MNVYKEQYYLTIFIALLGLFGTLAFPESFDNLITAMIIFWLIAIFGIGIYKNKNTQIAETNYDLIIDMYEGDEKNKYKPEPPEVSEAYKKTGRKPKF